jgi:DNA topoisomerase-1
MEELTFAKSCGLKHSGDNAPGYLRRRVGRGFAYYDEEGNKITDGETLARIKSLVIPPMWDKVWICPSPDGYIQATGRDKKNRKQYLYHPQWTEYQQQNKFSKLREFAYQLPLIRENISSLLRKHGWPKEKVIALILAILDETYVRIGNRQYYESNGTYGLTTLRRRNMRVNGNSITFNYKAKSNKKREVVIKNRQLIRLIRQCSELRGHEVFRYLDESGNSVPVDSFDVNAFLRELTGENFTSKNFRTWGGTVLAVRKFPVALQKYTESTRLKFTRAIVKEVAVELSNTIAVCEKYYIHPLVLKALAPGFTPEKLSL